MAPVGEFIVFSGGEGGIVMCGEDEKVVLWFHSMVLGASSMYRGSRFLGVPRSMSVKNQLLTRFPLVSRFIYCSLVSFNF
jgi:hypothetical protein